jgi:signal transduction histidine kinase
LPLLPTPDTEEEADLTPERTAEAMVELAKLAVREETLADVQRAQLGVLHALFAPKTSFLLELDPIREELAVAAVRGRNDERIAATRPGEGPLGEAFVAQAVLREEGVLSVPVLSEKAALGCVVVLGPRHEPSDTLAAALGAQVAAAWEFARLRDHAARHAKDLQTAIAGLKSLEQNREELLSNVSHDLKNPLATIKAYLSMLEQGKLGDLNDRQVRAVHVMERNADRLQKMVNDLLLLSRLQSGKMQLDERPFGIKALATDVLQGLTSVADRAKVTLQLERCPEVFVKGDRERMGQALAHLLEYAIHQSPEGTAVRATVGTDGGLCTLSLAHDGSPLPREELDHLFDSFHHPRGPRGMRTADVGLGLPIVARIIQLHGGKVDAGRLQDHTRFRIRLPAFAAAVNPAEEAPSQRRGDILLVEDDKDCREVLQEVLEAEGYSVLSASEPSEARALLERCHPALVLLDLRLANNDGRSVLHHIRASTTLKDTSVYIVSGASEVASLALGKGLDRIDGFFEKPLQLPRLLDTVASVVHPAKTTSP